MGGLVHQFLNKCHSKAPAKSVKKFPPMKDFMAGLHRVKQEKCQIFSS